MSHEQPRTIPIAYATIGICFIIGAALQVIGDGERRCDEGEKRDRLRARHLRARPTAARRRADRTLVDHNVRLFRQRITCDC